jgi:DNA replication protein DnaC
MRKQADKEAQERIRLSHLRAECVQDRQLANCVFASAEESVNILRCQYYVEHWEKMQNQNLGLLFWGEVGGGKTYAAACIANALLDRGVPVMVTSLPKIINSGWDKGEIISQLHRYPLMVLDDLGVERNSEYSLETVYTVLDERRKAQKPLIITTNLTLKEMRAPMDRAHDRIYSRVFEMCVPIHFPPQNYRAQTAAAKMGQLNRGLRKELDVDT